jgi:hypothetical protein
VGAGVLTSVAEAEGKLEVISTTGTMVVTAVAVGTEAVVTTLLRTEGLAVGAGRAEAGRPGVVDVVATAGTSGVGRLAAQETTIVPMMAWTSHSYPRGRRLHRLLYA